MTRPQTNMAVLTPSRKRPRAGDVFTYLMPDGLFRYGRVIRTDAVMGGMPGCLLVYLFDATSKNKHVVPVLDKECLLLPPAATNSLGWRRGYIETVVRAPLEPEQVLPQHCFRVLGPFEGCTVDEYGREVPAIEGECGTWALKSYAGLDKLLSKRLGFAEPRE